MKIQIPEAVSRKIAHQALLASKHSPTILFVAGVAGTIASTALACQATLKLEATLDKANEDLRTAESVHLLKPEEYSEAELAEIKQAIRYRTVYDVVKLYAPAVGVGILSVAALSQSHRILSRRNAAIGAAYAVLDQSFKEYRERVIEQYGDEKDRELRYGVEKIQVIDPETGRKKNANRVPEGMPSGYARFFDRDNVNWDANQEYNLLFLRAQQNYANDRLQARGYLILNDVYDGLGLPQTTAGAAVGWVVGGEGDGYVDFGIFGDDDLNIVDFVKGQADSILLDFNVDGEVFRLLDTINNPETSKWQS